MYGIQSGISKYPLLPVKGRIAETLFIGQILKISFHPVLKVRLHPYFALCSGHIPYPPIKLLQIHPVRPGSPLIQSPTDHLVRNEISKGAGL